MVDISIDIFQKLFSHKNVIFDDIMLFFSRRGESDSKLVITEGKEKYSLPSKCAWLIETDE